MKRLLTIVSTAMLLAAPSAAEAQCLPEKVLALPGNFTATSCQFRSGNDFTNAPSADLSAILAGWSAQLGPASGLQYQKFDVPLNALPGTYNFGFNVIGDFAFSVKQGDNFAVYLFDVSSATVSTGVQILPDFFGNLAANDNATSHGTLIWVNRGSVVVPEPASLALLTAGMLGLAGAARRRRAA